LLSLAHSDEIVHLLQGAAEAVGAVEEGDKPPFVRVGDVSSSKSVGIVVGRERRTFPEGMDIHTHPF